MGSLERALKPRDGRGGAGWLVWTAAAVGGYLLVRWVVRADALSEAIGVTKSVTIERPAEEVYRFWRNLENLPRVMDHLESVEERSDGQSTWTTKGPAGSQIRWDAQITLDRPNEAIGWRSLEGATIPNEGSVRFTGKDDGRRTEVRVHLLYHPPVGQAGAAFAKLFGPSPETQVGNGLRRLKQELETGSVLTSAYAHPSGRDATR
jgi:uncharacterized membrane protein